MEQWSILQYLVKNLLKTRALKNRNAMRIFQCMNPRHKKFCENLASGMSHTAAYSAAGYKSSGTVASAAASRLLKDVNVKRYLKQLNDKAETEAVLSVQARKELLSRIALSNEEKSPGDSIRASAELSKMDGAYEPEKFSQDVVIKIGGEEVDQS